LIHVHLYADLQKSYKYLKKKIDANRI